MNQPPPNILREIVADWFRSKGYFHTAHMYSIESGLENTMEQNPIMFRQLLWDLLNANHLFQTAAIYNQEVPVQMPPPHGQPAHGQPRPQNPGGQENFQARPHFQGNFQVRPLNHWAQHQFQNIQARPLNHGAQHQFQGNFQARPLNHGAQHQFQGNFQARPLNHGAPPQFQGNFQARPLNHGGQQNPQVQIVHQQQQQNNQNFPEILEAHQAQGVAHRPIIRHSRYPPPLNIPVNQLHGWTRYWANRSEDIIRHHYRCNHPNCLHTKTYSANLNRVANHCLFKGDHNH